jgi:hypothetical protein
MRTVSVSRATALVAALMLVLAAALKWPYGYFNLLRVVVFGCSIYLAWVSLQSYRIRWVVSFGAVALLFNPFLPIYLTRGIWQVIDIGVAGLMVASLFAVCNTKGK